MGVSNMNFSIFFSLFCLPLCLCLSKEEYPSPHMVMVGANGAGKSSLGNALMGCDPGTSQCMFNICGKSGSCTTNTTIGFGSWLGGIDNFTIGDTPGFGDRSDNDFLLSEDLMNVLHDDLDSTNVLLLTIDGAAPRFTGGLTDMLKLLFNTFGDKLWQFVVVAVTKWPYDQASIDYRQSVCDLYGDPSDFCHNEDWFMREFSQQIEDVLHKRGNVSYVFVDSFSQSGSVNQNDEIQQQYWAQETGKLWMRATEGNTSFPFLDINDVWQENDRINDIIDDEISSLKEVIGHIQTTLSSLSSSMTINENNIQKNVEEISGVKDNLLDLTSNLLTLSQRVDDVSLAVTENDQEIAINAQKIQENTDSITETGSIVSAMADLPIGTIISWVSKVDNSGGESSDLPEGWLRCDGSIIPAPSIWEGKLVPDLNNEMRFLRGAPDSSILTMESDQLEEHKHEVNDPGHTHPYKDSTADKDSQCLSIGFGCAHDNQSHDRSTSSTSTGITVNGVEDGQSGSETRPKNMHVTFIMRIF